MRFSENTRFPYPVLGLNTGDYDHGSFDADFISSEDFNSGALTLEYKITLNVNEIKNLLQLNKATVGYFVRCTDTYYTDLKTMSWPEGRTDFTAGLLINRVTLRPLIWLLEDVSNWDSGTINKEFLRPIKLNKCNIIAVGNETIITVGQAKLKPIESIFELEKSTAVPEGTFQVDLERDKITIIADPMTFDSICQLRQSDQGRRVIMNSIYLPVIMEILDAIREPDDLQDYRWYETFIAKCDHIGIDPNNLNSNLEGAQKLLDKPANLLIPLI